MVFKETPMFGPVSVAATRPPVNTSSEMPHRSDHISWAAEAVACYQKHSRSPDDHAIADLVCDLGHIADVSGLDFLAEIQRAIGHWYAERNIDSDNVIGPNADVEIIVIPK